MIAWETALNFTSGVFPNTTSVNSTGSGTGDGTEWVKVGIDNFQFGVSQALLDYAGLTPNGVTESAGASQFLEAIQKGHGIGPGKYVQWGLKDDPSVTGDRVLLLTGQGVLVASFSDLDDAVYVGDPDNATAPFFYHADDAAGTVRNIAGIYLILPPEISPFRRQYSEADGDFTVTATNWTTVSAVMIPYQTIDGTWRLTFNFKGIVSASATVVSVIASGIVFITNSDQAISGHITGNGSASVSDQVAGNSIGVNFFQIGYNTALGPGKEWLYSGDVELASKPTWAGDSEFPRGITY